VLDIVIASGRANSQRVRSSNLLIDGASGVFGEIWFRQWNWRF
jgi:hypothetical protein